MTADAQIRGRGIDVVAARARVNEVHALLERQRRRENLKHLLSEFSAHMEAKGWPEAERITIFAHSSTVVRKRGLFGERYVNRSTVEMVEVVSWELISYATTAVTGDGELVCFGRIVNIADLDDLNVRLIIEQLQALMA